MIKKFFGLFKRRWLIAVLGMVAVAVLIWHLGPLIAIAGRVPLASSTSRWLTIAGVLALWGLNRLRQYWMAKRKERQLQEELKSVPLDATLSRSKEEVAELERNFDEALQDLKSRLGGRRFGSQHLYQLPWYIIIGRSQAGKTTALTTADLNYIRKAQGVGSTRDCDWFFTDEAVLLDTAGRYVTQDSYQAVDSAGWLGFLDLLKRFRPRRPINGVLIAISIADLLQQDEIERAEHAHDLRQRLQELHERLGIRFPVYLLLTKCDLLAGFVEFFDDLGVRERSQVWGMTLPLYTDLHTPGIRVQEDFAREFQALEQRLHERLLRRLQDERDRQRRDLIYTFPQQFGAIRPVAEKFLAEVFQPNMRKELPLLRGVYFTSGTQIGTPIDRVMASLADAFHLDRQVLPPFSVRGKSYFVSRLLRDVIFPEAGLANTNLRLERQRTWLQRAAFGGALALVGLLSAAWFVSYANNQNYIQQVDGQLNKLITQGAQLLPSQTDVLSVTLLLDTARTVPGGYESRGIHLLSGFGLYQGDKLGERAIETYQKLLNEAFLPRLMIRLEEELRQDAANPEALYETLKVYLMLNDPDHFDATIIKNWLVADWQAHLPRRVTEEQRQALSNHLDALLENFPEPLPFDLDTGLIARVRDRLQRVPLAERVYAQLKAAGLREALPAFNIGEAAGPNAVRVFERSSGKYLSEGVPGFFTYKGCHQVFNQASLERIEQLQQESWVLGNQAEVYKPEQKQRLGTELRRLYLEDYVRQWKELLKDINIRPLSVANPQESVEIVKILSDPTNSPLRKLLSAVDRETSLERPSEEPAGQGKGQEQKQGVVGKIISKIPGADRLSQSIGEATGLKEAPLGPNLVDDSFADLHRLVQKGMDNVLNGLDELYRYLDAIANAANQGEAARDAAMKQAGGVLAKLRQEAEYQPDPVNRMLKGLTEDTGNLIQGRTRAYLNDLWIAEVLPFCRQALNDRYPLDPSSTRDMTLEDFGHFFGPGGLMDTFFQKYLQSLVDVSQTPWRWTGPGGAGEGISQLALLAFQHAAAIRKAFFGANQVPAVSFELKPITMDAEASQFLLDLGGQQITYNFDPAKSSVMKWPSPDNIGQVRIRFEPPSESGPPGVTEEGPWAWFRVLDRANLTRSTRSPEVFNVTFQVGNHYATYELRASSAFNPFSLKELQKFRCPERL